MLRPEEVPAFYTEMLKLRIVLDYFVIRRTVNGTDSDYSLLFADTDHGERLMQYEAMLHVRCLVVVVRIAEVIDFDFG